MIPEIGHIFLILTFVASIMQIIFWIFNLNNFNELTLEVIKKVYSLISYLY